MFLFKFSVIRRNLSCFLSKKRSLATSSKFPYGVSSYRNIIKNKLFCADKTSYIEKLELAGDFNKIWRPRRLGKTLLCDMLSEYYDAANSKEQLNALFGDTDIGRSKQITDKGKFLVLKFCFAAVNPDGDVKTSFKDYINDEVHTFAQKYHMTGLLKFPVEIDHNDALSSLLRLFRAVENSDQKIYLIVDECDSFANRLLLSIDTSNPDLGLQQYKAIVSGPESMMRNWGNVIKTATSRSIARAFFTGVSPHAFTHGLSSSLNMVTDLTFNPWFAELFGLTRDDVCKGLDEITSLKTGQRVDYANIIKTLYEGYRFVPDQDAEPMYNTQYVLYYLRHLDQHGEPPRSIVDPDVCESIDNVAKYLISNHKAGSAYSLQNFALGIFKQEESESFVRDVVSSCRSTALFNDATIDECLISLAFFHGFLTFKRDEHGRSVLTSTNQITKTVFAEALFDNLPRQYLEQFLSVMRSNESDDKKIESIKSIGTIGRDEAMKAFGQTVGTSLAKTVLSVVK